MAATLLAILFPMVPSLMTWPAANPLEPGESATLDIGTSGEFATEGYDVLLHFQGDPAGQWLPLEVGGTNFDPSDVASVQLESLLDPRVRNGFGDGSGSAGDPGADAVRSDRTKEPESIRRNRELTSARAYWVAFFCCLPADRRV